MTDNTNVSRDGVQNKGNDVIKTSNPFTPNYTNPEDAGKKKDDTIKLYGEEEQDADNAKSTSRQDAITDSFAMSPDEWFKMYGYWNWNLAKDNPNGNLNGKTFTNTLGLSRLADALNNRRHWRAAKIGRRTNSSFGTNEYQEGHSERWEPIETQEMRQMRANEQVDAQARARQVNRAENIQDYPLESRKAADAAKRGIATVLSQSEISAKRHMQQTKFDKEYAASWDEYWNELLNAFTTNMPYYLKEKVYQKLINLRGEYRQMYAKFMGMGGAPDELTTLMIQDIVRLCGNDPNMFHAYMTDYIRAFSTRDTTTATETYGQAKE